MCMCLFIQDPLKEKETEMMMDYIERFNEVTNISCIAKSHKMFLMIEF